MTDDARRKIAEEGVKLIEKTLAKLGMPAGPVAKQFPKEKPAYVVDLSDDAKFDEARARAKGERA